MKYKNFFLIIFKVFIVLLNVSESFSTNCDNKILYKFGLKLFCESDNELAISCFDNLQPIKKVNIQCSAGYRNEDDISRQIIYCMDNGEWSKLPLKCTPICGGNPNNIELIDSNQSRLPTWYVEIIKKTSPNTKFPGIILFEREIISRCKYFTRNNINDFVIRFHNDSPIEYKIKKITPFGRFLEPESNCQSSCRFDEICGLSLQDNVYIKFDENIKPACSPANSIIYTAKFLEFFDNDFQENRRNQFIPALTGECSVPQVNNAKIEVNCFKSKTGTNGRENFESVECLRSADLITTRCRVGYQNRKQSENDYLSRCQQNDWQYISGKDNDCELVCGLIDTKYRPSLVQLIHKGDVANIISAPWHVAIYANNSRIANTIKQICGGTIIHSNIIISAAHCVYDRNSNGVYNPNSYLVGAGKFYRAYEIDEEYDHFARVERIHIPPNYHSLQTLNDIAILILDHHLKYTSHIKPACLNWESFNNYNIREGIVGYIAGWGSTSKEDIASTELRIANFTTLTNNQCKKLVDPNYRSDVTGDKFCAKNGDNASACRGDSGGGFVVKKNVGFGERFYLDGIISTGYDVQNYCSDSFLTFFTNIQLYQDLVKSAITDIRNSELY